MYRQSFFLMSFITLAACQTPEQIAARQQQQADQIRQKIISVCQEYGFKPGTPNFLKCVDDVQRRAMQQQQLVKQRPAYNWGSVTPGTSNSFGESMVQHNSAAYPRNTQCIQMGPMTNCQQY